MMLVLVTKITGSLFFNLIFFISSTSCIIQTPFILTHTLLSHGFSDLIHKVLIVVVHIQQNILLLLSQRKEQKKEKKKKRRRKE